MLKNSMKNLILVMSLLFTSVPFLNAQELRNNHEGLTERITNFAMQNDLSETQKSALLEVVQKNRASFYELRINASERLTKEEQAAFRVEARERVLQALDNNEELVKAWYIFQREQRKTILGQREQRQIEKIEK